MLDFRHAVFAVADGTERFPWASRDILKRLRSSLVRNGLPETLDEWVDMIHDEVYSDQQYQHKTTFSCVAVSGDGDERTLFVAHGGDSVVTLLDPAGGSIVFQTGRDMNFAGRSKCIADCTEHRLADRTIKVALSTDGFDGLVRYCRLHSLFPSILRMPAVHPVERICEEMHQIVDEHQGKLEHDDISLVVIDPFTVRGKAPWAVLIGGTRAHEEERYLHERVLGISDQWRPEETWNDNTQELALAGIEILAPGIT